MTNHLNRSRYQVVHVGDVIPVDVYTVDGWVSESRDISQTMRNRIVAAMESTQNPGTAAEARRIVVDTIERMMGWQRAGLWHGKVVISGQDRGWNWRYYRGAMNRTV